MSTDDLALRWADSKQPIDLLYIDADHSYEQSMIDFMNFSQWVVPNGLILMHDTVPLSVEHEQEKFSGNVWRTMKEIKRKFPEEYELGTIPSLSGLSIIRKKGSKYF
jgi:cephalosporin hydroxylase